MKLCVIDGGAQWDGIGQGSCAKLLGDFSQNSTEDFKDLGGGKDRCFRGYPIRLTASVK